jgi:hypothetical protein
LRRCSLRWRTSDAGSGRSSAGSRQGLPTGG